jgi:hypothetical protein
MKLKVLESKEQKGKLRNKYEKFYKYPRREASDQLAKFVEEEMKEIDIKHIFNEVKR